MYRNFSIFDIFIQPKHIDGSYRNNSKITALLSKRTCKGRQKYNGQNVAKKLQTKIAFYRKSALNAAKFVDVPIPPEYLEFRKYNIIQYICSI